MNHVALELGRSGIFPVHGLHDAAQVSSHQLKARQFEIVQQAFRQHGGLAAGDALELSMRTQCAQPISYLARGIVRRTILSLEWRSQLLIPMFQFDPAGLVVRPSVASVLAHLSDVFDDWELAFWFAQPNVWLQGALPVDIVGRDGGAVYEAALADRFVAAG